MRRFQPGAQGSPSLARDGVFHRGRYAAGGKEKPYSDRKSAGSDGHTCRPERLGLLHDLPLVVGSACHVGKEGDELEAYQAGLVTEGEPRPEYLDSAFEDLTTVLKEIRTKVIAEAPGYNPCTVRRLKQGEFRPSARR